MAIIKVKLRMVGINLNADLEFDAEKISKIIEKETPYQGEEVQDGKPWRKGLQLNRFLDQLSLFILFDIDGMILGDSTDTVTLSRRFSRLASSITAGATSLTVDDGANYPSGGGSITVGTEQMVYTSRTGDVISGLSRGVNSTVAQSHDANSVVSFLDTVTATALNKSYVLENMQTRGGNVELSIDDDTPFNTADGSETTTRYLCQFDKLEVTWESEGPAPKGVTNTRATVKLGLRQGLAIGTIGTAPGI